MCVKNKHHTHNPPFPIQLETINTLASMKNFSRYPLHGWYDLRMSVSNKINYCISNRGVRHICDTGMLLLVEQDKSHGIGCILIPT